MIPVQGFGGTSKWLARLMGFIDGGYLREQFRHEFNSEIIDFDILKHQLVQIFDANCGGHYKGNMVRVYYYDGRVLPTDSKFNEQEEYFAKIRNIDGYDVRFGRLKPTGENRTGPLKQKGVDVRMAVDMITKAYLDHYDFAIMLAGDDDFLDVVNAVKDTGKRVYGIYFSERISKDLLDSWDVGYDIQNIINLLKPKTS